MNKFKVHEVFEAVHKLRGNTQEQRSRGAKIAVYMDYEYYIACMSEIGAEMVAIDSGSHHFYQNGTALGYPVHLVVQKAFFAHTHPPFTVVLLE